MPMKSVSSSTMDSDVVKLSRAEERVAHAQMTKETLQSKAQWRYGLGKDVTLPTGFQTLRSMFGEREMSDDEQTRWTVV
jgi:hypothetical protein